MKYKFAFNAIFRNLNGTEVQDAEGAVFLGKQLAQMIANTRDDANMAMKLSGIAHDLYKNDGLILDNADTILLRQWVENRTDLGIEFKAQLLYVFENKVAVVEEAADSPVDEKKV